MSGKTVTVTGVRKRPTSSFHSTPGSSGASSRVESLEPGSPDEQGATKKRKLKRINSNTKELVVEDRLSICGGCLKTAMVLPTVKHPEWARGLVPIRTSSVWVHNVLHGFGRTVGAGKAYCALLAQFSEGIRKAIETELQLEVGENKRRLVCKSNANIDFLMSSEEESSDEDADDSQVKQTVLKGRKRKKTSLVSLTFRGFELHAAWLHNCVHVRADAKSMISALAIIQSYSAEEEANIFQKRQASADVLGTEKPPEDKCYIQWLFTSKEFVVNYEDSQGNKCTKNLKPPVVDDCGQPMSGAAVKHAREECLEEGKKVWNELDRSTLARFIV
jgi:hypothetical protein